MRKQGLSRRERNMVEEAVTQVCWAMGVNPRGTLSLMRASRAYAFVQQREYVVPEDIKAVAVPVLAHRLAVTGGVGSQAQKQAVEELLQSVPVPTEDWT